MKQYIEYGITILEPDDNFKYITNNKVCSEKVYLGKNDSVDNWHDTNDDLSQATIEDTYNALNTLGVKED